MQRQKNKKVIYIIPKDKELLKLHLGCGQHKEEGWVNVDITSTSATDVVWDLRETPWPWEDNSISEAKGDHFLEHLDGPERMVFFNELYRVLTPKITTTLGEIVTLPGKASFSFPYYTSMRAIQDYSHKWPPLCEASFLYLNKEWREVNKLDHYPITCDYNYNYGHSWDIVWGQKNLETRTFALNHYNNVVYDLIVHLETKKLLTKE